MRCRSRIVTFLALGLPLTPTPGYATRGSPAPYGASPSEHTFSAVPPFALHPIPADATLTPTPALPVVAALALACGIGAVSSIGATAVSAVLGIGDEPTFGDYVASGALGCASNVAAPAAGLIWSVGNTARAAALRWVIANKRIVYEAHETAIDLALEVGTEVPLNLLIDVLRDVVFLKVVPFFESALASAVTPRAIRDAVVLGSEPLILEDVGRMLETAQTSAGVTITLSSTRSGIVDYREDPALVTDLVTQSFGITRVSDAGGVARFVNSSGSYLDAVFFSDGLPTAARVQLVNAVLGTGSAQFRVLLNGAVVQAPSDAASGQLVELDVTSLVRSGMNTLRIESTGGDARLGLSSAAVILSGGSFTSATRPAPTLTVSKSPVEAGESFTVSWTAVDAATSYVLQSSRNSSFTNPTSEIVATTSAQRSIAVSGSPITEYYRVRADNSTFSNIGSVTAMPPPSNGSIAAAPSSVYITTYVGATPALQVVALTAAGRSSFSWEHSKSGGAWLETVVMASGYELQVRCRGDRVSTAGVYSGSVTVWPVSFSGVATEIPVTCDIRSPGSSGIDLTIDSAWIDVSRYNPFDPSAARSDVDYRWRTRNIGTQTLPANGTTYARDYAFWSSVPVPTNWTYAVRLGVDLLNRDRSLAAGEAVVQDEREPLPDSAYVVGQSYLVFITDLECDGRPQTCIGWPGVVGETNENNNFYVLPIYVPRRPQLRVAPASITETIEYGETKGVAIDVENAGDLPLIWTATATDSGVSVTVTSQGIVLTLAGARLGAGLHVFGVDVSSNGGQASIPVTVTVGARPVIALSIATIAMRTSSLDSLPINIRNGGGGNLSWSVGASEPWMTTSTEEGSGEATIWLRVDPGTRLPGVYRGYVVLRAPWADSVAIPVELTVPQRYAMTIESTSRGRGRVSMWEPASSLQCEIERARTTGTCIAVFDEGVEIVLAVDMEWSQFFRGWGADAVACGSELTCRLVVSGPLSVTVAIDPIAVGLEVALSGTGAGRVTSATEGSGSFDCVYDPSTGQGGRCFDSFWYGYEVVLTAIPAEGSVFAGWGGSTGCGVATSCATVAYDGNLPAEATFSRRARVLVSPTIVRRTVIAGATGSRSDSADVSVELTGGAVPSWAAQCLDVCPSWFRWVDSTGSSPGRARWKTIITGLSADTAEVLIVVRSAGAQESALRFLLAVNAAVVAATEPIAIVRSTWQGTRSIRDSALVRTTESGAPVNARWVAMCEGGCPPWFELLAATGRNGEYLVWRRQTLDRPTGQYVTRLVVTPRTPRSVAAVVVDTLRVLDSTWTVTVRPSVRRWVREGATGWRTDSAMVYQGGRRAAIRTWSARCIGGCPTWFELRTPSGRGDSSRLRWRRRISGLPADTYVTRIVVASGPASDTLTDSLVIQAPVSASALLASPAADSALSLGEGPASVSFALAFRALVGGSPLNPSDAELLDSLGNRNGRYDLGDFMAYADRLGVVFSSPSATAPRRPRSGARQGGGQ